MASQFSGLRSVDADKKAYGRGISELCGDLTDNGWVYMVERKTGLYVGITTDLENRMRQMPGQGMNLWMVSINLAGSTGFST